MTPDPEQLLGGDALGDALVRLRRAVDPRKTIVGWATVELDRAEVEVASELVSLGEARVEPAADERLLGARCRLLRSGEDHQTLLLEPSTEDRLAAALARYGEGRVVLYLLADIAAVERARRAGFTLSGEKQGPFGPARLVNTGPWYGPFLVLVEPG